MSEQTRVKFNTVLGVISLLTIFATVIAFAVSANMTANAATEINRDHETRLRVIERTLPEMSGDIKTIRIILERMEKEKGP